MKVLWCQPVFDQKEINAVVECLNDGWLGGNGPYTEKFEQEIADVFQMKYGVFMNSGSSSLLCLLDTLPKDRKKIITPACTFSTTFTNIVKAGFEPVLVDVNLQTFVVDPEHIESAMSADVGAVLIPSLVGNLPDFKSIQEICKKHNVLLIEDACDYLGNTLHGNPTGEYVDAVITSVYGTHHITAGGSGGLACVNDQETRRTLLGLRDWGRIDLEINEDATKRFDVKLHDTYYDNKFTYQLSGYNMKGCEMQSAFGSEQLKKLNIFNKVRKDIFKTFYDFFSSRDEFILPETNKGADISWLAFPLSLSDKCKFDRKHIMTFLEGKGVQTRVLFSGNIIKHPVYEDLKNSCHTPHHLNNSDYIFKNSFMFGCHHGMTSEMANYIIGCFNEYLS